MYENLEVNLILSVHDIYIFACLSEIQMLEEMHANNNDTWLRRTLFINGKSCEWERRGDSENVRHQTDSVPTSYPAVSAAHAVNKPQGKTDKTRRCPMAISVETSSSVSEGYQLSEAAVN